jgi:hypothetical protein
VLVLVNIAANEHWRAEKFDTMTARAIFVTNNPNILCLGEIGLSAWLRPDTKSAGPPTPIANSDEWRSALSFVSDAGFFVVHGHVLYSICGDSAKDVIPETKIVLAGQRRIFDMAGAAGPYVYLVSNGQKQLTLVEPRYRIVALEVELPDPVLSVGFIRDERKLVAVMKTGHVLTWTEASVDDRYSQLIGHDHFPEALKFIEENNMGPGRRNHAIKLYAEHLHRNGRFGEAITHFIQLIGVQNPAEVIRLFVEPHQAEHLLQYLNKLREENRATQQHTTLMFNCYFKLHQAGLEELVDEFCRTFYNKIDIPTICAVLCRNGRHPLAEKLALAYGATEVYLQLLYEWPSGPRYSEMRDYMTKLMDAPDDLLPALREYGYEMMAVAELRKTLVELASAASWKQEGGRRVCLFDQELHIIFLRHPAEHFEFLRKLEPKPNDEAKVRTLLIEVGCRSGQPTGVLLPYIDYKDYPIEHAAELLWVLTHAGPKRCREGRALVFERLKQFVAVVQEVPVAECLKVCQRLGQGNSAVWLAGLKRVAKTKKSEKFLTDFLKELQKQKVLPLVTMLREVARSGNRNFGLLKTMILDNFRKEQDALNRAVRERSELQKKVDENRARIKELEEKPQFLQTRCVDGHELSPMDRIHFLCGHSYCRYHADASGACRECKDRFAELEKRRRQRAAKQAEGAGAQQAKDGFEFVLDQ